MRKYIIHIISLFAVLFCYSCSGDKKDVDFTFFGDNVLTIVSSNKSNGYDISIIASDDLCLWHFRRGDSINRYLALHKMPLDFDSWRGDSIGTYKRDITIPSIKRNFDGKEPDFFFMDVNFDGEKEFVVKYPGYSNTYYACFDLFNGNSHEPCIGFLSPMDEAPYTSLVGGKGGETRFDYQNKEIYVLASAGMLSRETWAKMIEKSGLPMKMEIYKVEETVWLSGETTAELGYDYYVDTYQRINDTLKLVSHRELKY